MALRCVFFESLQKTTLWTIFFAFKLVFLMNCTGPRATARQAPWPLDTLNAYQAALDRDDPASAYQLLDSALKQRISSQQFLTDWRDSAPERSTQRKQIFGSQRSLGPAESSQVPAERPKNLSRFVRQAVLFLPQGTSLLLAQTQPVPTAQREKADNRSVWRIADSDLSAVHADTPEQLLRLLITAAEQRNYFAVLRLFSAAERQAIEAELRERIDRLRMSLNNLPSSQPGRAPPQASATEPQGLPNSSGAGPSGKAVGVMEMRGDRIHYQYDPRFFIDLVQQKDGWRVLDLN